MDRACTVTVVASVLMSALSAGCLGTHHPTFGERSHLGIAWRTDLPTAAAEAERRKQPILLVGVSGKVDGAC
jgi:hypothetical protein